MLVEVCKVLIKMVSLSEATASELPLFGWEMLIQVIEREPVLLKFISDKY